MRLGSEGSEWAVHRNCYFCSLFIRSFREIQCFVPDSPPGAGDAKMNKPSCLESW